MNIFSPTPHLLWYCWLVLETCEGPTCTLVPICSFFSHSQICHTPHTHPPLHACLAMAIRQKFNNVPWQKLCQRTKTGPWHVCVLRSAMEICLVIIFVKNISQRLFQRAKIGTWHVYAFWNMQWHSSLACSCKNPHNGERVKWLTLAICVEHYSLRFVHAYALAGDSVCPNVLK